MCQPRILKAFSILKDASATAIYGSRGANGVMIVTTKGGEYNSKTSINVTAENSFNYLDKFPEFVDGATYMDMYNKAFISQKLFRYTQIQCYRHGTHGIRSQPISIPRCKLARRIVQKHEYAPTCQRQHFRWWF